MEHQLTLVWLSRSLTMKGPDVGPVPCCRPPWPGVLEDCPVRRGESQLHPCHFIMGNVDTKAQLREAVIRWTRPGSCPMDAYDEQFWNIFWSLKVNCLQDVYELLPAEDIRRLREEAPFNLATFCLKAVDQLVTASRRPPNGPLIVNVVRLLTRIIPFLYEDGDWRHFFWETMVPDPSGRLVPAATLLMDSVCDLLFCPGFTVPADRKDKLDAVEPQDWPVLDSCEFIWGSGLGMIAQSGHTWEHDANKVELLHVLLVCFSEGLYDMPDPFWSRKSNLWIEHFASAHNRHALSLFTSMVNLVCGYEAHSLLPYNHLLFHDAHLKTVEVALQVLIVLLDDEAADNLMLNYLSRIHRDQDFQFLLHGVLRLLRNPLQKTYLPRSQRKVAFTQELLIFLWKLCERNKSFILYVLKSNQILEVLEVLLHHLLLSRSHPDQVGLIHVAVFILLLLSGERNMGVRLNKPLVPGNPPLKWVHGGNHADLMIGVFHQLITSGHPRLRPLYECLLTIVCNVSPYIKSLTLKSASCLLHLLEIFSTPWFLFAGPHHHHLLFFLLQTFNNLIQYQFNGNANLVYALIQNRQLFYSLANLQFRPTASGARSAARENVKTRFQRAFSTGTPPSDPTRLLRPTKVRRAFSLPSPVDPKPFVTKAAGSINEWVPSESWMSGWKSRLPLHIILRLLQVLAPQVQKMAIDQAGYADQEQVLQFIKNGTLVGLLPVPHPIMVKKYQSNPATRFWATNHIWSVILSRKRDPDLWKGSQIEGISKSFQPALHLL